MLAVLQVRALDVGDESSHAGMPLLVHALIRLDISSARRCEAALGSRPTDAAKD